MKKSLLPSLFFGSFALAQSNLVSSETLADATLESNGKKKTLIEKIKEKELKLQVPRETVPVEAINYPIKTPIPKTAEYLPMLQTLLHIEAGSLPNPIGVSIIGSYTEENYKVTKFSGQMGPALSNLGNISTMLGEIIPDNLFINSLLFSKVGILWEKDSNPNFTDKSGRTQFLKNLEQYDGDIANALGSGTKEWTLSSGKISTKTSAVGMKADTWLFPFMQLFVSGTYLHMEQETDVGWATIPFDNPIPIGNIITGTFKKLDVEGIMNTLDKLSPIIPQLKNFMGKLTPQQKEDMIQMIQNIQADVNAGEMSSISFPVGTIRNVLDGWAVMGGTNLAIGYKGFFLSCMIGGGYVKLDDLANNVKGFVKKPFMYIAPRIGYSLGGVFTAHFGVQRIELFGSTSGNDLSASTGGLVQGYSVEIEKFPVNFLVGTSFTPMRDLGISFEYITSPDSKGLNAEIAYRF